MLISSFLSSFDKEIVQLFLKITLIVLFARGTVPDSLPQDLLTFRILLFRFLSVDWIAHPCIPLEIFTQANDRTVWSK